MGVNSFVLFLSINRLKHQAVRLEYLFQSSNNSDARIHFRVRVMYF
jgi:hypothetical protein